MGSLWEIRPPPYQAVQTPPPLIGCRCGSIENRMDLAGTIVIAASDSLPVYLVDRGAEFLSSIARLPI